jgi:Fic family protein
MAYNQQLPEWAITDIATQVSERLESLDLKGKQELIKEILGKARERAVEFVESTLWCAEFLELAKDISNDRQHRVLKEMMNTEMTPKKYQALTGCSKATATRELADMLRQGLIKKLDGRGRSTAYTLNF